MQIAANTSSRNRTKAIIQRFPKSFQIPENTTVTIVDSDINGTGKMDVALTTEKEVTLGDTDLGIKNGTHVTIKVDGVVVKTVAKDSAPEAIEGLAKGKYLFDTKTSDTAFEETEKVDANKDRNLYTAFEVKMPANTVATAKVGTDAVKKYVAKGAELTVTVKDGNTVKIGDQVVTADGADKEVKVTVTSELTIAKYQTPEQFKADVADKTKDIKSKEDTDVYKLTVDGKSATLVIASGKNINNVHGTNIGSAAMALLNANYTIKAGKYTFTKANSIDSDGNLKAEALTAMQSLIPTVDSLVDTEDKTETLTITVSNATGASEVFTVTVTQKV